jgi:hypothetical protein
MTGLQVIQIVGFGLILLACALGFSLDSYRSQRGLEPSEGEKKARSRWVSFRRAICYFVGFLFLYAGVNGLLKGDRSAFPWVALLLAFAIAWVGAYGLPDRSLSSLLIDMMPKPPLLPALPRRAVTWNRTMGAMLVSGFIVALLGRDWLSATSAAAWVASTFPAVRATASSSIDPGFWLTYFTIMIGLQVCLLPVAAICLAYEVRERPPRFIPWQIGLGALMALLCWFLLIGSKAMFDGSDLAQPAPHGRSAVLFALMTQSRLGLALVGSAYMCSVFLLFSGALVALPIAIFKAITSGWSWRE